MEKPTEVIELKKEMLKLADPKKATILQGFFKTGPGQYGEGDIFLGITVPALRKIAKRYMALGLNDLQWLLDSKFHEHRLVALLILVEKYNLAKKNKDKKKESFLKEIVDFYLKNTRNINNWDLVDLSAEKILGDYVFDKDKKILEELARSKNVWERRIAIIATFDFIKKGTPDYTFRIAEMLLDDRHDLIHKAVGWMLREAGKRVSQQEEEVFLKKHTKKMPRTMLRYAIERFDEKKKKEYMKL